MENQHRMIKGYRELSEAEITRMNQAKTLEAAVLAFIKEEMAAATGHEGVADARWLAIAQTDIQKGFMALGRAIARPDGY